MGYTVDRKHPRYEFRTLPWVFGLQAIEPAKSGQPIRLEAKNISLGGCKFASNTKIPLFHDVQITIYSQKNGVALAQVNGKVVRLEEVDTGFGEKTFGIAVQFKEEHPALKTELNSFQKSKS